MSTSISELMNSMGGTSAEGSTSASEMMPFCTKTGTGEIVPLQSVEIGSELFAPLSTELSTLFISGETYLVNFNGTVYECEARQDGDYSIIGNGTIYGDNVAGNNEPFSIESFCGFFYLNTAEAGSFTVSISGKYETVEQLEQQYAPIKKFWAHQGYIYIDPYTTKKATKQDLLGNPNCVFLDNNGRRFPLWIGEEIDGSGMAMLFEGLNGDNYIVAQNFHTVEHESSGGGGGGGGGPL